MVAPSVPSMWVLGYGGGVKGPTPDTGQVTASSNKGGNLSQYSLCLNMVRPPIIGSVVHKAFEQLKLTTVGLDAKSRLLN